MGVHICIGTPSKRSRDSVHGHEKRKGMEVLADVVAVILVLMGCPYQKLRSD